MGDSTISQLPLAATVNLSDFLVIDQGGVTKRIPVSFLASFVGTFPPAIDLPMANHKFTGLAEGTGNGDSVRFEQVAPMVAANLPALAGFMDRTDVTLTWSNTTRTLTIAPTVDSYQFYAGNTLFTKTVAEQITIADVTASYYFFFDEAGTLSVTTTFSDTFLTTYAFIASLYWNESTNLAVPDAISELHGAGMPTATHLYIHNTIGTAFDQESAGLLPSVTADGDGSDDAHIEFSATPGAIWDDDVKVVIPVKQLTDNIPVLYRTGASGVWTFDETSPTMVRATGTGRAAYNQLTGGTWQLTEVTDGNYLLMHLFAIPGFTKKWMMIMGQAEYASLTLASDAAETEITSITGIPFSEHKDVATFVIQTADTYSNSVKSRVVSLIAGGDFFDWRFSEVGGAGVSGTGGDVVGPVGATDGNIVLFDGSTGKILKDSGQAPAAFAPAAGSASQAFSVAAATTDDHAVNRGAGDARYAALAGLGTQTFSMAPAAAGANGLRADQAKANQLSAEFTVAANALTVSVNPCVVDFRSSTLTTAAPNTRFLTSAATVIVPDTATLGTTNGIKARLVAGLLDNAGTLEAFVINQAGTANLDESGVISTTAISTGADSENVPYSTTARTNVPYKLVGACDVTEATAGTWATAPSAVYPLSKVVVQESSIFSASGTTALTAGVTAKLSLTSEDFDTAGEFDAPNSKFVASASGYYQFDCGSVYAAANSSLVLTLHKNGSPYRNLAQFAADASGARSAPVIHAAAGDYFELFLTSGITQNASGFFGGHLIRRG